MNLIAAADLDWGISYKGRLLFDLPPDLRRFKEKTTGKIVIMGAATFRSLPKAPLPDRVNIVLSTTFKNTSGFTVVKSENELFSELEKYNTDDVFVIGGEAVYRLLLDKCSYAFITKVFARRKADRFMPDLDNSEGWTQAESGPVLEYCGIEYRFMTYRNESPVKFETER